MSEKVMIAMSGGVDSSVAAYLLKKEGYDCTGVTMKLYGLPPDADPGKEPAAPCLIRRMPGVLLPGWKFPIMYGTCRNSSNGRSYRNLRTPICREIHPIRVLTATVT